MTQYSVSRGFMMMGTDDRTDDRAFGADDVAVPARSSENYVFR
jgi:hypothetical protein